MVFSFTFLIILQKFKKIVEILWYVLQVKKNSR